MLPLNEQGRADARPARNRKENAMKEIPDLAKLRAAFWRENPNLAGQRRRGKPANRQTCDVRTAFSFWIEHAAKSGRITETLANMATL